MKITLSFFLWVTFFSLGSEAALDGCKGPQIFQLQQRIDENFLQTYKSKYDFANIFCREHSCFRAFDLRVKDVGGDVDTGRVDREITSVSCTSSRRLGMAHRVSSPITTSRLNTSFKRLVRENRLLMLEHPAHVEVTPLAPANTSDGGID